MQDRNSDFKAIESSIRGANIERSAYLGAQLGTFLADLWLGFGAMIDGAKAGMDEHRRRRVVAAAHAAHVIPGVTQH